MSVTTTVDEKLDSVKEHVNEAYKDLLTVLNPDTWGSDEYKPEYVQGLHKILLRLQEIRVKLC